MKTTSSPSADAIRVGFRSTSRPQRPKLARWLTMAMSCASLALASQVMASDPIGVYAYVDKVVFEPEKGTPERVQVWGGFALADGRGGNYATAKRGYLYLEAKDEAELARTEWKDLKMVAGTGQVVSFGSRHKTVPTVRDAKAEPKNPDPYPIGFGLTKIRPERNTEYKPLKELKALQEIKDKTTQAETSKK